MALRQVGANINNTLVKPTLTQYQLLNLILIFLWLTF